MQQLYARQKSAVLVLPAATGGEQLFENECAVANLGLVPAESAEVAERSEHRRREQRAGAESASGRYRREQRHLDTATERTQLLFECAVAVLAEARQESGER